MKIAFGSVLSTPQSTDLVTSKGSDGSKLIIMKVKATYEKVPTIIVNFASYSA
jgi:hypothetical protein